MSKQAKAPQAPKAKRSKTQRFYDFLRGINSRFRIADRASAHRGQWMWVMDGVLLPTRQFAERLRNNPNFPSDIKLAQVQWLLAAYANQRHPGLVRKQGLKRKPPRADVSTALNGLVITTNMTSLVFVERNTKILSKAVAKHGFQAVFDEVWQIVMGSPVHNLITKTCLIRMLTLALPKLTPTKRKLTTRERILKALAGLTIGRGMLSPDFVAANSMLLKYTIAEHGLSAVHAAAWEIITKSKGHMMDRNILLGEMTRLVAESKPTKRSSRSKAHEVVITASDIPAGSQLIIRLASKASYKGAVLRSQVVKEEPVKLGVANA